METDGDKVAGAKLGAPVGAFCSNQLSLIGF